MQNLLPLLLLLLVSLDLVVLHSVPVNGGRLLLCCVFCHFKRTSGGSNARKPDDAFACWAEKLGEVDLRPLLFFF